MAKFPKWREGKSQTPGGIDAEYFNVTYDIVICDYNNVNLSLQLDRTQFLKKDSFSDIHQLILKLHCSEAAFPFQLTLAVQLTAS